MDMFKLVEFDIRGTEPKNRIKGEDLKIKDKTCPWVIPDGAPFFTEPELFTLYDGKGAILTLNKDYFLEEEFIPFCDMSGRSIKCFVRLSDDVLKDNNFVTADYQSIGAWFVPRNNLEEWLALIQTGKPVPWSKVFGVPPTLPPEWHKHSVITEIGDWYELSFFFNYMAGIYRTRDTSVYTDVDRVIKESFDKLTEVKNAQLGRINTHDSNYSAPHNPTKADILLGNLDNFGTATLADDFAGIADNLFSTPQGVQDAVKARIPDTSDAMYAGIIPISQFGNNTFIPPNISGSFEGIGQETETSGICLEPSGIVMLLSNHMDGRTQGLYFSIVENYNNKDIKITYTNHKYRPPVLQNVGIEVNRIIAGSGNKVIMTGVLGTNNWYIALTNNTFDPAAHSYVSCDMSAVTAVVGSPYGNFATFGSHDRASIHHMGQYLVLIQNYTDADNNGRNRFYRVLTDDVRAGRNVVWQAIPLSYSDWEGNVYTNQLDLIPQKVTYNASRKITRLGRFSMKQPVDVILMLRRDLSLSAPIANSPGNYYYHVHQYYHMSYLGAQPSDNYSRVIAGIIDMVYTFNPATGVLSLKSKSPELVVDFTPAGADDQGIKDYPYFIYNMVNYFSPASVVFPTGEIVSSHIIEGGAGFPTSLQVCSFNGVNTPEDFVSKPFDKASITTKYYNFIRPLVPSPTNNGTFPAGLTFDTDGEFFEAVDQSDPGLKRRGYFRKVTGAYAIRDGVTNLTLGNNINSRPLTNEVYKTNLIHEDGTMGLTGTNAECLAAGVDMGTGSMSYCAYSATYALPDYLPNNLDLRAPASGNVLMSFPRTFTKVFDKPSKTVKYTPTSFFGLRQNIIDQLKAYTNGATRWAFTIVHLGDESGGLFKGMNVSVIAINWVIEATQKFRTQMLIARPVLETPNDDHPGVHLVTSYTILQAPPNVSTYKDPAMVGYTQFGRLSDTYVAKPYLTGYKDGNNLKVLWVMGHGHFPLQTNNYIVSIFDLNLTTNQFTNLAVGSSNRLLGDLAVMWPNVGLTDVTVVSNSPENNSITMGALTAFQYTGGGASIFRKTGTGYIMTASVYPETGWVLFFQDNIQMMINGTTYVMPGGTVDLRDIEINPANKTFYVYATIESGEPKYVISAQKLRKRGNLLPAASMITNDRQILTITRNQPFMVGDFMLSETRDGGTIPVSAGFPQDQGNFIFLKRSELLP